MDKDVVHRHSGIKTNEMMPFAATGMHLEIITLAEVRQKARDTYHNHMLSLICGILSMAQVNLSMKQEQHHRRREQAGGGWGPGVVGACGGRLGLANVRFCTQTG